MYLPVERKNVSTTRQFWEVKKRFDYRNTMEILVWDLYSYEISGGFFVLFFCFVVTQQAYVSSTGWSI